MYLVLGWKNTQFYKKPNLQRQIIWKWKERRGFPGDSVVKKKICLPLWEFDPLVKEMATHSSILSGEIPWTEKAGRL